MWFLKRTFTSFRWMTLVTSLRWLLWLSILGSCSTVNSFNLPSNAAGQMNTPQFILVADLAFGRRMWKYALNFKTFSFKLTATFQSEYPTKMHFVTPHTKQSFAAALKMAFRNSVLKAFTTEVLTRWGMRSHARAHEITTKSLQHTTLGSTCKPLLSSAGNFVSAQFEDFVDKTPLGLLQVHAREHQNTSAPSGLNWMHLGTARVPWRLSWAGTANPSAQ